MLVSDQISADTANSVIKLVTVESRVRGNAGPVEALYGYRTLALNLPCVPNWERAANLPTRKRRPCGAPFLGFQPETRRTP